MKNNKLIDICKKNKLEIDRIKEHSLKNLEENKHLKTSLQKDILDFKATLKTKIENLDREQEGLNRELERNLTINRSLVKEASLYFEKTNDLRLHTKERSRYLSPTPHINKTVIEFPKIKFKRRERL
jgi:hypothetical protein